MVGVSGLPYFFVRRLKTGRWCVAHRVPGTDFDAVDMECADLAAAWTVVCEWNEQREVGLQIKNVMERA